MNTLNPNVTEERVRALRARAIRERNRYVVGSNSWGLCDEDVSILTELLAARRTIEGAAGDVIAERQRQVEAEGWTPEHDDEHSEGQMAAAAVCYAFTAVRSPHYIGHIWPWSSDWFKPTSKRRNLVKASALILAEIERLDRAALSNPGEQVE